MHTLLSVIWHYARNWPKLILLYALSTVVMIALWVIDPLIARYVIDLIPSVMDNSYSTDDFLLLFGGWLLLTFGLSLTQAVQKSICWRTLNYVYITFQRDTYEHILNMDVMQHIQRRAGAIIKKIDNAADQIWDLGFQMFQVMLPSVISALIFVGIAFTVHVRLTLIVLGALLAYSALLYFVTKTAHPIQRDISRIWVSVIGRAYDTATNILTVKSAAGERREVQRMRYWNERGLLLQNRTDWYWSLLEGLSIFMLLRALIIGLGILFIARDQLTLGELFFFIFIIFRLVAPIEVVASFLPKWNEKIEKVRMGVYMGTLPSLVKNPPHGKKLSEVQGEIVFDHVDFSYEKSVPDTRQLEDDEYDDDDIEVDIMDPRINIHEKDLPSHREPLPMIQKAGSTVRKTVNNQAALTDVTLQIEAGEHIALVGHSGAGKSTIASLVNRFFDVSGGAITLDGIDLREFDLYWLRRQFGLVLQDSSMFNDSVMENIRYTNPHASDEDVRDAARRASADEFIMNMPEGYKTNIGERGVRLSGGERQRIAIARAIIKNPAIVVLDEATSALDSKTEKAVQEGIAELIAGRTAIIIAHRLSTVRSCDRIAVLDKGRLIACAPHEELMKSCDLYKEMVELQSNGMLAE